MTKKDKFLSADELISSGVLQEANRLFFHPLGLALCVMTDDEGVSTLHGIIDARDGPGGFVFADLTQEENKHKANSVEAMKARHKDTRLRTFGWVVQPLETRY